ncbi:hypothetical protein [Moraxella equi]|uniref:Uncharacterized protein n=1 Tax=Moraxella equi TaxID=60442 RepID=A0A378QUD0_9GAMM|nr:hypothetical protein [Moraxella equi]OPH40042.1 hypothetical protein B5J93_01175 [Moraxella equi]STZ04475.1 Uncharacterised protein [Moraxella equi]
MFLIILFRILFYVFFITFFAMAAYLSIEKRKNSEIWSGKKSLAFAFTALMSFFLAMYFAFSEPNRLIKYHLKNKSYHEVCGIIDSFSFYESRGLNEKSKPTRIKMNNDIYSANHFYSYENFDKYQIGDKICIQYFIQFQHIHLHLPSARLILYITKPNSTVYDNHISLTDEFEEFRDEQP